MSLYEQSESISLAFVTAPHGLAEEALLTEPHRLELQVQCVEATSAASTQRDDVRLRPGKRELDLSATGSVASPSAREPQLGGSVDLWSATVGSHEGSFAETMSTWSTAGAAVNSSDALALIASPAAAR